MGKLRVILVIVVFGWATNAFSQNQIVFSRTNFPGTTTPLRPVWRIEFQAPNPTTPYSAYFYFSINAPAAATVQNVRFTWNITNVNTTNPEVRHGVPLSLVNGRTVMSTQGLTGSSGASLAKNGSFWSNNQNYGPIELQFILRNGVLPSPAPRKLADFTIAPEATINGQTARAPLEAGEIWLGSPPQQQQPPSPQLQQQQPSQQQWGQMQQYGLISGRGTVCILKRRFNLKSGKVELIKNGVISRSGFLNLQVKDLNRRQALRNYRYR